MFAPILMMGAVPFVSASMNSCAVLTVTDSPCTTGAVAAEAAAGASTAKAVPPPMPLPSTSATVATEVVTKLKRRIEAPSRFFLGSSSPPSVG